MSINTLIAEEDNLIIPTVGNWAETKYDLIFNYNSLFSTGMKKHWWKRVYIDLYSGSGKAKIRNTDKIVYTSPLLAMKVKDPFDKYIFCDIDEKNIESLRARIKKEHSEADVVYMVGDCNEHIDKIVQEIPPYSKENTVLSFCFIDPYSLKLSFDTLKRLSDFRMDFLILLALCMDGKRNINLYIDENHDRIDKFLGLSDWRKKWEEAEKKRTNLVKFLADEFTKQMVSLGYKPEAIDNFIPIRSDEKNLPLYYLAFFSKHERGYDFWKKVKNLSTEPELGL